MARRRMISDKLIYDEHFNALSIEAQNIFVRMLAKTDDCGIIPANVAALAALINPPDKLRKKLAGIVTEIADAGLGFLVTHGGRLYFLFKPSSFLTINSYIINKRVNSEYLGITADEFDAVDWSSKKSSYDGQLNVNCSANDIVSSKQKVESRKQKETEMAVITNGKIVIPDGLREKYAAEFGRGLMDAQIPKMERWLSVNQPKKDVNRFIWNWLNRAATSPSQPRKYVNETPVQSGGRSGKVQSVGDVAKKVFRYPCVEHPDVVLVDGQLCPKCFPVCSQCGNQHSPNESCHAAMERLVAVKAQMGASP